MTIRVTVTNEGPAPNHAEIRVFYKSSNPADPPLEYKRENQQLRSGQSVDLEIYPNKFIVVEEIQPF